MNVLIPASGKGSRFAAEGYEVPKPFIRIKGKPMIAHLLHSLPVHWLKTVVIRQEHAMLFDELWAEFPEFKHTVQCVAIPEVTRGAAETVKLGILNAGNILGYNELMVVNCDNLVDIDLDQGFYRRLFSGQHGILTMFMQNDKKWSYVAYDMESGRVGRVAEKEQISAQATCGFYFFSNVMSLLWAIERMMDRNDRVNGEFYLAPVYNYLIEKGDWVQKVEIDTEKFHGVGTPEELRKYERHLMALEVKQ